MSPEGINLFLAGGIEAGQAFLSKLRSLPEFADIEVKQSFSEQCPFRRMLVRLKKEIISFGVESVRPIERTSPKLSARELKRWLDEGRRVRLLDTRNQYEVDLGSFVGAEHLSIGHFREFPRAIEQLPEQAKREPLVMFCTGGIRCEKAGPMMEQAGFEQVYQLDGGILKYFEECGDAHYQGSCFVFDGRVALDAKLQPTGDVLCFACQAVLTCTDIQSDQYRFGETCPHCFVSPVDRQLRQFQQRQAQIRSFAESQPGCQAYDHVRHIHVAGRFAGLPLIDFLLAYHPAIQRDQWLRWIADEQILFNQLPVRSEQIVKEGQCFEQHMPGTIEPSINPDIKLLHEDSSIVVVNKPAPLPSHASGRYNKNSLLQLLGPAYPNQKLRLAHRLDANTSGVVVLCRKHQSARWVQPQFSARGDDGPVHKTYLARVHGHPAWDECVCEAPLANAPQQAAGLRGILLGGQPACTELRVLKRYTNGTALIEARPRTGRTHQIRIHLWHLDHAVVGDPLYLPGRTHGSKATLSVEDPPMCLHALRLSFIHPETLASVSFEAEPPDWSE